MIYLIVIAGIGFIGVLLIAGINIYVIILGRQYVLKDIELNRFTACRADAVLVLGCRVYEDGTPSRMLRDRVHTGVQVFKRGTAYKLLMTGDSINASHYDEVGVMCSGAVSEGIPLTCICRDDRGLNTLRSMTNARDTLAFHRLIIVTQAFHVTRSVYLARQLGLEAYGFAAAKRYDYRHEWLSHLREICARVKGWLDITIHHSTPQFKNPENSNQI